MNATLPTISFPSDDGWSVMHVTEPYGQPIEVSVYFGQEGAEIQLSEAQEEGLRIFLNLRHERRVK